MSTPQSSDGFVASQPRRWFRLQSHQFPCELGARAEQKVSGVYTSFRIVCENNEWFVYGYKFAGDKDFFFYFLTPAEEYPYFPSWAHEENLAALTANGETRFVDIAEELNSLHDKLACPNAQANRMPMANAA